MDLWVSCLYSKATQSKNFSAGFLEKSCGKVECTVCGVNRGSAQEKKKTKRKVIKDAEIVITNFGNSNRLRNHGTI